MAKKNISASVAETKFKREYSVIVDGFEVVKGDLIKVVGQHGARFRFDAVVTNTESGSTWVDCFEMHRNVATTYRSFDLQLVKRVPQRGKRAKRVI